MNVGAKNCFFSEPRNMLNSHYNAHLAIGRSSVPKSLSIDSIEKGYNLLIGKYHKDIKYSLQINNKIKCDWKERFTTCNELSIIGTKESSIFKDFDKWKAEGKHKLLFTPEESLKIARIFITDESSLEMLLMLADIGSKSIEELCNAFYPKETTIKVLFNLWEYDVISVKENRVNITHRGNELVSKLIKKSQEI